MCSHQAVYSNTSQRKLPKLLYSSTFNYHTSCIVTASSIFCSKFNYQRESNVLLAIQQYIQVPSQCQLTADYSEIYSSFTSQSRLSSWFFSIILNSQKETNTFVEIDHEIISTAIRLLSADLFKKGCCQLQAKVCARITG